MQIYKFSIEKWLKHFLFEANILQSGRPHEQHVRVGGTSEGRNGIWTISACIALQSQDTHEPNLSPGR